MFSDLFVYSHLVSFLLFTNYFILESSGLVSDQLQCSQISSDVQMSSLLVSLSPNLVFSHLASCFVSSQMFTHFQYMPSLIKALLFSTIIFSAQTNISFDLFRSCVVPSFFISFHLIWSGLFSFIYISSVHKLSRMLSNLIASHLFSKLTNVLLIVLQSSRKFSNIQCSLI